MTPRAGRRILKGNAGATRLIFVSDSQEIDAVRFSSDEQMLEKLRKISRRRSDHYIFRVRRHPEARVIELSSSFRHHVKLLEMEINTRYDNIY